MCCSEEQPPKGFPFNLAFAGILIDFSDVQCDRANGYISSTFSGIISAVKFSLYPNPPNILSVSGNFIQNLKVIIDNNKMGLYNREGLSWLSLVNYIY